MTRIEELTAEWKAIPVSELTDSTVDAKDGETEAGFLLFHLRQMCMLGKRMEIAEDEKIAEERENGKPEWSPECMALIRDAGTIRKVFWDEVRREFPEIPVDAMPHVRKGWKVTWSRDREVREMPASARIVGINVPDEIKAALRAFTAASFAKVLNAAAFCLLAFSAFIYVILSAR